jgi:hypothetical protein
MGDIARSFNRQAGAVSSIQQNLGDFFERKRQEDMRAKLKEALTQTSTQYNEPSAEVTDATGQTTGAIPGAPAPSGNFMQPDEIGVNAADRQAAVLGGAGPNGQPGGRGSAVITPGRPKTVQTQRDITPQLTTDIGDLLKLPAEQVFTMTANAQAREKAARAAQVKGVGYGSALFDQGADGGAGKEIYKNDRLPPQERATDKEWVLGADKKEHYRVPVEGDTKLRTSASGGAGGKGTMRAVYRGNKLIWTREPIEGDEPYSGRTAFERRAESRIAKLTADNQKLGQNIISIQSGLYTDADGNKIAAGTTAGDSLASNMRQQIKDNENMLKMLNERIGGDYTGEDGGADIGSGVITPPGEGEEIDPEKMNRAKQWLDANGYQSEEQDIRTFLLNNPNQEF